jgi:hypothetical protein
MIGATKENTYLTLPPSNQTPPHLKKMVRAILKLIFEKPWVFYHDHGGSGWFNFYTEKKSL